MGLGGLLGGVIGGLVGACVWAGVEYTTGYQVGWIAWGIGALAGIGVQVGSRSAGGAAAGLMAAAVAVGAVVTAKALVANLIAISIGPEQLAIAEIADEVHMRYVVEGYDVEVNDAGRTPVEYYPHEIWSDAEKAWSRLSPSDRESRVEAMAGLRGEFNRRGLLASFSPYDILWFVLAMATAFKLGSAAGTGVVEGPINFEEVPADGGLPAQLRAEERKESAARQLQEIQAQQQLHRQQQREQAPAKGESLVADSLTGILGVAGGERKNPPQRRRAG